MRVAPAAFLPLHHGVNLLSANEKTTMKLALISILAGSAAAFAPAPTARTSVAQNAALDDLKSLAEKSNPVLKVS